MASATRMRQEFLRINLPCNQSCLFCSIVYSSEDDGARAAEMLERIDAMGRDGVTHLTITGGEPTINPRLPEYLGRARAAGIREVVLETNATRLAEPGMLDTILDANPGVSFFVSLHSHRPDVSDLITQDHGGFERTTAGLDALAARGVSVALNHVLCSLNAAELAQLIDVVADRWPETRHVTVSFIAALNRALDHAWTIPAIRDIRPALRAGIARAREREVRVRIPDRCGVPPCILPEAFDLHDTSLVPAGTELPLTGDRHKAARCASCELDPRCLGLWREYAERHGDAELRPLRLEDGRAMARDADVPELAADRALRPLPAVAADATGLTDEEVAAYRAGERASEIGRHLADARFHQAGQRPEAALRAAWLALQLDRDNATARQLFVSLTDRTHVRTALQRMREGHSDEAREILRWVLAIDRDHPSARAAWRELMRHHAP